MRSAPAWRQALWAGTMPLALLAGCVAIGFGLHTIAAVISGADDPSFAHPWALRLGLAFGVWSIALLAARLGTGAIACWLWLSGLGVVTAALLPGISPFFVFPSLVAAAVLPFAVERRWLLLLPALAASTVWLGLAVLGEVLLGLQVHPLFTVAAGFALIALSPLLPALETRPWIWSLVVVFALAIAASVVAGLLPAYTAEQPQRLHLRYIEADGRAFWAADPVRALPAGLRTAGHFSAAPDMRCRTGREAGMSRRRDRRGSLLPRRRFSRQGDNVTIRMHGSATADVMELSIPEKAGLYFASIGGWKFDRKPAHGFIITCATAECRGAAVLLRIRSSAPVMLALSEQRFGLPPDGDRLVAARAPAAVTSGFGDRTVLVAKVAIPAR